MTTAAETAPQQTTPVETKPVEEEETSNALNASETDQVDVEGLGSGPAQTGESLDPGADGDVKMWTLFSDCAKINMLFKNPTKTSKVDKSVFLNEFHTYPSISTLEN